MQSKCKPFESELEERIWNFAHNFNGNLQMPIPDMALRYLMDQMLNICLTYHEAEARKLQTELRKTFINETISSEK